jgi:hypothetical protein
MILKSNRIIPVYLILSIFLLSNLTNSKFNLNNQIETQFKVLLDNGSEVDIKDNMLDQIDFTTELVDAEQPSEYAKMLVATGKTNKNYVLYSKEGSQTFSIPKGGELELKMVAMETFPSDIEGTFKFSEILNKLNEINSLGEFPKQTIQLFSMTKEVRGEYPKYYTLAEKNPDPQADFSDLKIPPKAEDYLPNLLITLDESIQEQLQLLHSEFKNLKHSDFKDKSLEEIYPDYDSQLNTIFLENDTDLVSALLEETVPALHDKNLNTLFSEAFESEGINTYAWAKERVEKKKFFLLDTVFEEFYRTVD